MKGDGAYDFRLYALTLSEMVTYEALFAFTMVLISLVALFINCRK